MTEDEFIDCWYSCSACNSFGAIRLHQRSSEQRGDTMTRWQRSIRDGCRKECQIALCGEYRAVVRKPWVESDNSEHQ